MVIINKYNFKKFKQKCFSNSRYFKNYTESVLTHNTSSFVVLFKLITITQILASSSESKCLRNSIVKYYSLMSKNL